MAIRIKDYTAVKPFCRPIAKFPLPVKLTSDPERARVMRDNSLWLTIPQSQFMREYYPSGHLINDPNYYPDRIKYDEEKQQYFTERVIRCAFPLQMIITSQHLVHIAGNDTRHELTDIDVSDAKQKLFLEWQQGWLDKNIETTLFHFYKSCYIVGDGAIVFYVHNGKSGTTVLSALKGDKLRPSYNSITGELESFSRVFSDYDEDNNERVQWLEVWDNKYLTRYRLDKQGFKGKLNKVKETFGLENWSLESRHEHGFSTIPVVYHRREEGACWSFVQDAIDKYELAVSYLCQNNMAYAFPIMVLKGDNVDIQGDMYGQVKAITADASADISYLERSNNTGAFELQLNTLLKQIFLGSFTVMPPEVKSGDLPGVAIKLIYSPSLDRAMIDAKEFDHVIDDVRKLFTFAYGIERERVTQYQSLNIISYIVPYVHQNSAELINNLVQSVNSGILSHQTASTLTGFGQNSEFDNITRENKQEESADLLYQQLKAKKSNIISESEEESNNDNSDNDNNNDNSNNNASSPETE